MFRFVNACRDSTLRRFYLPQPLNGPLVRVTGNEAHHLLRVMRQGVGSEVLLFDGAGHEALARIAACDAGTAELRILEHRPVAVEKQPAWTLATAVPKGERFDWLVEKGTELGLARLVPLITDRSVVIPREGKIERLRRTIVEACKQCGRGRLMELEDPVRYREFAESEFSSCATWVADPRGEPAGALARDTAAGGIVVVGPEGGLTDEELDLAERYGARRVSLGSGILRIETAGIALAALLSMSVADENDAGGPAPVTD
jgi:16S rRNA (uracil1498-N3)-methyltransferase